MIVALAAGLNSPAPSAASRVPGSSTVHDEPTPEASMASSPAATRARPPETSTPERTRPMSPAAAPETTKIVSVAGR